MSKKYKKIIYLGGALLLLVIISIIILVYRNVLNDIKIKDRIGYIVECSSKDDSKSMNIWLEDYMNQFKQKLLY